MSAADTMSVLMEVSDLLNTGLDADTLALCVRLCEQGVNPEALAVIIKELRRETAQLREQTQQIKQPDN